MRWLAQRRGLSLFALLFFAAFPAGLKAQQPTLTSVVPQILHPGNAPDVVLFGTNFQPGIQCDFGADITVNSCTSTSTTQLIANLTISPSASTGSRSVTVTNPDGTSASLNNAANIGSAPYPFHTDIFNVQSDDSGTVTVQLTPPRFFGTALLIGLSFWPADVTSVTVQGHETHPATRGLTKSVLHDVPGNPLYTNYYYVPSTSDDDGSTMNMIINFSGGSTRALITVAQAKGIWTAGDNVAVQFAYNESTTPTASWADAITPDAFNEYLFAWGATRNATTCANPGSGWTIEGQTNVPAGATICLIDTTMEPAGQLEHAAVGSSTPQDYAMGMIAFDYFSTDAGGPNPPIVSSTDPNSGSPGQNLPDLAIAGSVFNTRTNNSSTGFVCSFGADITVNSCTLDSSSQLTANITISPKAAQGPRDVTVTNWFFSSTYGSTVAGAFSVVPPPETSDFKISLAAPSQAALPGGTVNYKVNLTAGNGFDQPVSLGCTSMPAGVSCLAPPPVTPTASGASATITLETGDTVAPSTTPFSFTITASGGGLSRSVPAQISVAALSATITPASAAIGVGGSANFDLSLSATDAFTAPVTLACAGLAPGLRCVPPAPTAVPGSATLAVFVDSKPGTSSLPPHMPRNGSWPSSRGLALLIAALTLVAAMFLVVSWRYAPALPLATFASALLLAISLISCSGATTSSNRTLGGAGTTASASGASGSGSGGTTGTSGTGGSTGTGTSGSGSSGSGSSGSGGSGGSGSGGSGSGSGGTGGSGGGSSVTTQFTVQAQSGGAVVTLGTISVTVP